MFDPDYTQESAESLDSEYGDIVNHELLEDSIKEVREMRPRLFDFMYNYGRVREESEQLENENMALKEKIAELTVKQPKGSLPHASDNGDAFQEEIITVSQTMMHILELAQKAAIFDEDKICDRNFEKARKELEQVKSACDYLETIFEFEQTRFLKRREENGALKEKLQHIKNLMLDEIRSGDAPNRATLTPSLQQLRDAKGGLDKRNLIVDSVSLLVEGREPVAMEMNPMGTLQRTKFCVKEGTHYRIRIDFFVQGDSIKGLKYIHKVNRLHVNLSKTVYRLGTCTQQREKQSFTLEPEPAPEGVFHRGKYTIKSQLIDENKQNLLTWSWTLKVVKKW